MVENTSNRAGVAVGIITRGWVPTKWMMHMDKVKPHLAPVGTFWKYIIVNKKSWAPARNEVIEKARKENFEWVFYIDDDVFIAPDTLQRFMAHGKDIITGIYWTKTVNSAPVIFEKMGAGPMYNFDLDRLFEVDGSGLGVCLINMKVFDAFDKAGIPYFKENWVMEMDDGKKIHCPVGEDHYFFYHAKKFGFKVWADSGVLCDHYDVNKDIFYPSPETVRNLCEKGAKIYGQDSIIASQERVLGERGLLNKALPDEEILPELKKQDKKKKSILFLNLTANPFAGDELERRGVGGSETDIINLSRLFANEYGIDVHVACTCPRPGTYDNVKYYDLDVDADKIKAIAPDLLIVSRNARVFNQIDLKKVYNAKMVCLWTHDMPGDPAWDGFEQSYPFIDAVFVLTEYHKKGVMEFFPFVEEKKVKILCNGVNYDLFKDKTITKVPGRMVYTSTPFRGLELIPEIFERIKEKVPHAHIKIFSSMKVYGDKYDDGQFMELYNKLKMMDGVEYVGSIKQVDLAKELQAAELLTYPNIYPETACIAVMEAQAAGTPIVTSAFAALNETVPDDVGVRIAGSPYTEKYKQEFVDAAVKLLTDKEEWTKKHLACLSKDNSWRKVAKVWIETFFPEELNKATFKDCDDINQCGNINTEEYWNRIYEDELAVNLVRNDTENFDLLADKTGIKYMSAPRLLDVGCGVGSWTRYVKDTYPNSTVWGCDFSSKAIDYCRQKNRRVFYANHPLLNGNYEKHYFDVITALHIIEHLDKPEDLIIRAKELLKKTGRLVLAIPLNDNPWPEHVKIWNVADIEELLKQFNCTYDIMERQHEGKYYADGRPFMEAIVTIKFKGE